MVGNPAPLRVTPLTSPPLGGVGVSGVEATDKWQRARALFVVFAACG